MGFSRQEHWSVEPIPSPGDLPDPGIEPGSPALQADSFLTELCYQIIFIYVFLAVLGLHCCAGFSLVVVRGFLIAADSVFVEYKL